MTDTEQIAQLQRELAEAKLALEAERTIGAAFDTCQRELAEARECIRDTNRKLLAIEPKIIEWRERAERTEAEVVRLQFDCGRAWEKLEACERIAQLDALIGTITLCAECNGTRIPKPPKQPYCCPIGHARECDCAICQWRRSGYEKAERIAQLEAENESLKAALREAEKALQTPHCCDSRPRQRVQPASSEPARYAECSELLRGL